MSSQYRLGSHDAILSVHVSQSVYPASMHFNLYGIWRNVERIFMHAQHGMWHAKSVYKKGVLDDGYSNKVDEKLLADKGSRCIGVSLEIVE